MTTIFIISLIIIGFVAVVLACVLTAGRDDGLADIEDVKDKDAAGRSFKR